MTDKNRQKRCEFCKTNTKGHFVATPIKGLDCDYPMCPSCYSAYLNGEMDFEKVTKYVTKMTYDPIADKRISLELKG